MIDCEYVIFNTIALALREKYNGASVVSEAMDKPSNFPAISIVQINSSTYDRMMISTNQDFNETTFEVNVYANNQTGKRFKCKEIINDISEEFKKMGFKMAMCEPIENFSDTTIYRIVARFSAVLDDDGLSYTH